MSTQSPLIDSHHHLWHYSPSTLPWIGEHMTALRRDYLPADLEAAMTAAGVHRAIAVQAQQNVDETRWLLATAAAHPAIAGVVGWVPLVDAAVERVLDELAPDRRLRGVRHIVHDEPDDRYLLREDVNRGVACLRRYGLVYDVLIFARHLPHAIAFVDRHPDQPFVLDHIGKPVITAGRFDDEWARGFRELARRPHVTCKLSGIVTEVRDPSWSLDLIRPYVELALEAFGPSRLMFGTDWPVCRLRCEYGEWVDAVRALIGGLNVEERADIMGGTAARVYGLAD